MRRIIKDNVPDFWSAYLRRHHNSRYDDLDTTEEGKQLRRQIREHMLEHQKMICCYCCKSIDSSNSHNEHIKPKDLFPQNSMDYDNLLVSCTSKNTCGMAKGNHYDLMNFVSPLQEGCEEHFSFFPDGQIKGETDEGAATVECLNLNTYDLRQARKQQYKECCNMARYMGKDYIFEAYMQEKDGSLPRFVDMITYFYNRGDFDSDVINDAAEERLL